MQVSAYSSFARIGAGLGTYEQQKRRVDPNTNEPLFTNCTRDFIGTLDYIFYSGIYYIFTCLSYYVVLFKLFNKSVLFVRIGSYLDLVFDIIFKLPRVLNSCS